LSKRVRTVFASVQGEVATAASFLRAIAADEALSPARFAQSVHNTPSGLFSIAAGNLEASTTLSAGVHTLAIALQEAHLLLLEDPAPVLVSFADEAIPVELGALDCGVAFGCALLLERADMALPSLLLHVQPGGARAHDAAAPEMVKGPAQVCAFLDSIRIEKAVNLKVARAGKAEVALSGDAVANYSVEMNAG
jgi:hypothetical protein